MVAWLATTSNILLGYIRVDSDDFETVVCTKDILTSEDYFEYAKKEANGAVYFGEGSIQGVQMLLPYVEYNCTRIEDELVERYLRVKGTTSLSQKMTVNIINEKINEDEFAILDMFCDQFGALTDMFEARTKSLNIKPSDFREKTLYVKYTDMKSEVINKIVIPSTIMHKPDDPVYFTISNYLDLEDVVTYPNIPARLITYSDLALRRKLESFNWKDYAGANIASVEGDAKNNELDIQENEKNYYDALCDLMRAGLEAEYPDKSVEMLEKANVRSKLVEDYILTLCHLALVANRKHTGRVRLFQNRIEAVDFLEELREKNEIQDTDENSDANEINAEQDTGLGYYSCGNEIPSTDALLQVRSYINNTNNTYASCEALIKLLRWGSRKPTKLKLKGNPMYLDLNSFKLTSWNGEVSNLEEVVYEDESNRVIVEGLYSRLKFLDISNYLGDLDLPQKVDAPIGLTLLREFENVDVAESNYVDFLTVIEEYVVNKNKNYKILGIDFKDGKFSVNTATTAGFVKELITMGTVFERKSDSEMSISYPLRTSAMDKLLTNKVLVEDKSEFSVLKLINKASRTSDLATTFENNVFATEEERKEAIAGGRCISLKNSISWEIIDEFLAIVLRASAKLTSHSSLEDCLNAYYDEYKKELGSIGTAPAPTSEPTNTVVQSTAFGTGIATPPVATDGFDITRGVVEGPTLQTIKVDKAIKAMYAGELVGYIKQFEDSGKVVLYPKRTVVGEVDPRTVPESYIVRVASIKLREKIGLAKEKDIEVVKLIDTTHLAEIMEDIIKIGL